ncbi:MAG: glycosyltransferase family 2 protein [Paludibacteraceae bacterium]|nr:glycosyltransferase family 2 protein [Paludibacteraceae bacterium]
MVEIVLSSYNGSRFIDQQIESIANQTFGDWLLTVRDDGSQDDTVQRLESWQNRLGERMRIMPSEGNVGVVRSFELLLGFSKGDYVMMCDQDDVWLPRKVEMTLEMMKEEEKKNSGKAVAVFTSINLVDGELKPKGMTFFEQNHFDFPFAKTFNNICVCNCVAGCTMMLNRNALRVALPFAESVPAHDWWVAAKVARNGILSVLETPTMLYRLHGNNVCGADVMEDGHYRKLMKSPLAVWRKYAEVRQFLKDVGFRWGFAGWLFYKLRHVAHRKLRN